MSNFSLPIMEFEKFKAECYKYALDLTVAKGGGDDILPQFRALQVASPSSSPQVNVEEMWPDWAEFKFKPKQHSPRKHKGEESLLQSQVSLPKKPRTSMLMKSLTIHEWPKPKGYNGKALIYYGTIKIEDSSDEDDDQDDDESDNEDTDVDVETLSDSEEENEAIRDYFPQLARPVERICIGNFLPMGPIVHNPVVEDFEDDEEDDDYMDDEGYEDMSTEEEEEDEKEEEEKEKEKEEEEVVLVRSPNCLGPCAEIERIVGSDINRCDALDRIVAQL